ncbi:transcription factor bHLH113-like [Chenopodium quinoa]|uniref:transcription factor bHLH113-like n=1 Tax=Chenopodium quinoa TaxID=63459 RepID=UPI000B77E18F|nr:transcription factor bHLH113-like [Chenopodium quinoa]
MTMGENGGKEGEIHLPGGSFSRLLLSLEDVEEKGFSVDSPVSPTLFSSNTPNMLCFGDFISKTTPKFSLTTANTNNLTPSNSNKRRNEPVKESGNGSTNGQNQKNGVKKNKTEMGPIVTSSPRHVKGKREKLGERIAVLQQLVSPYGKTDTSSVLHEAMGYIRFLHDQVKVLSTPYLKLSPSSSHHSKFEKGGPSAMEMDSMEGLSSRGLCLVPLECILHVANNNGADFWSSATITSPGPGLEI